ncbi:hypothetical protein JYU34_000186 [Plutella xylostella]|uniref:Uncharacterized protein n=1 Tax=Plutella xylostella TaxID=51655 RepID=A0ABQ7R732_PLUXY|nr:hypothetical protein JYU34_000186 [Plutella xylostella]
MPGTSQASLAYSAQELPSPSPPVPEEAEAWKPPMGKKRKTAMAMGKNRSSYVFLRCEREARERERVKEDRAYELDKERLTQSDIERQERVRQRDIVLQLQASWLEFMKEGMRILERVLNERV